jgi:hypothetical protein
MHKQTGVQQGLGVYKKQLAPTERSDPGLSEYYGAATNALHCLLSGPPLSHTFRVQVLKV